MVEGETQERGLGQIQSSPLSLVEECRGLAPFIGRECSLLVLYGIRELALQHHENISTL